MQIINNKELWSLYTSEEEYCPDLTDSYNRFNYSFSKNRNVFTPSVSEYIFQNGFKPKYPGNAKFAVVFSHDVDLVYRNQLVMPGIVSRVKQKITRNQKQLFVRVQPDEWSLERLMQMEYNNKLVSTYYFMSLLKGERDFNYDINEVSSHTKLLVANGCEIGLHGGHQAYNDKEKNFLEKQNLEAALGFSVRGYRNHYLRHQTPSTWALLANNGFTYDSTFGYADCVGFRNGICYPFQPYDRNTNSFIDIIELPLIIMDVSMFHYMSLSVSKAFDICQKLTEQVEHVNGVLTFLFHNNYMNGKMLDFYQRFISYIISKDAWFTTSSSLVDWWKKNNYHIETNNMLLKLK